MLASLIALLAVVSAPYTPSVYACDGVTAAFTVNFPYLAKADVVATSTTAAGVATVLSTSAYNLSVTSASVSATLTLNVPATSCPSGSTLTIARNEALTQPQSFRAQTSFNPALHEQAFDRLEMQIQQLNIALPSLSSGQLLSGGILPAGSPGQFLSPSATSATGLAWVAGASAGSFTANGTGAVIRTISDKLSDVVSVKDFAGLDGLKAQGDGVHDDTSAIQAAITAAAGGVVDFPQPSVSYRVTGTITLSIAGTTLRGNHSKIYMNFGATTPVGGVLFSISTSDVELNNVYVDSTGSSTTTSINHYAVKALGTSGTHLTNIRIRNCTFTNLPWMDAATVLATHAIYVQYADNVTVEGSTFEHPSGAAIILSVVTGPHILHNFINNTGWYSIQLNDQVSFGQISGNNITGTLPNTRVWGGSINLMSNSTTGGVCGTPGCAQIHDIEIDHNLISGVHSYTAAVHIESSSRINFHHNPMKDISLTYGMTGYPGSPFYADGTPPDYIRVYVRPVSAGVNEGPNDHITITDNPMLANGPSCIAIYADAQDNGSGTLGYSDTLLVARNPIISTSSSNYFAKGVIVHGQQGGWKNVSILDNPISGFPDSSSPVSGLIGTIALGSGTATVGVIERGNTLTVVGGTPSSTTHLAIAVDAFTQQAQVTGNYINGFWDGIRTFTNASALTVTPNTITGSGHADYTFGVAPTVPTGTLARYGSLFLTGRGSALAASNVVAAAAAGEYRLCATGRTTTSGTGTTATLNLIWTDDGGVKTDAVGTWALNAVDVTGQVNKCEYIHSVVSGNIQVSVSGTFGSSLYAISATAEKLN